MKRHVITLLAFLISSLLCCNVAIICYARTHLVNLEQKVDTIQMELILSKATVEQLTLENEDLKNQLSSYKQMYCVDYYTFPLPEQYRNNITSTNGYRDNKKLDTGGAELSSNMHNGNDYACPDKTPVVAAMDGRVVTVYPGYYNGSKWQGDPVYGGMIEIAHANGTKTVYGHLSRTDVKEGMYVSAGEQIGLSGGVKGRRASGASTGPHLHFNIMPDINNMFASK